jgi:gluconokinase
MNTRPVSPFEKVAGLLYFGRMLDKIRLHHRGELPPEYHANLGLGGDGLCCGFLHLDYEALKARVLAGGTDEEVAAWCEEHGRPLNETDRRVWNGFISKLGWNDFASGALAKFKTEAGLAERDDIETMPHLIDVEEGRQP